MYLSNWQRQFSTLSKKVNIFSIVATVNIIVILIIITVQNVIFDVTSVTGKTIIH